MTVINKMVRKCNYISFCRFNKRLDHVNDGTGFTLVNRIIYMQRQVELLTCGNCKTHTFTGPGTFTVN